MSLSYYHHAYRLVKHRAAASLLFLFIACLGFGQTTIWSEDFSTNSNNDITGNDNNLPAGADWTTSCSSCNLTGEFRVEGGEFQVENTDEIATWTSETIDISGYSDVSLSVQLDMNDNQLNNTDCMTMSYDLDGGGNTQFATNGNLCGDGLDPVFATQTGLNGSTLVIVIEGITTNNNEDIFFDNIEVTGTLNAGFEGPGGVGATDGSDVLEYWIDANNGISGSSPITAWTDLSGNGVTNTIVGNPTLTTSFLNGMDVVTFDGSGDYISSDLSINSSTFPNLDIYAVYYSDGTTSVGAPWGEDNGGFDRFLLRSNNAGPGCNFAITTGSGCTDDSDLFPSNAAVISGVYFAEDVSSGSEVEVNGTSQLTFTSNHGPEGTNNFDVGSIGTGGFQYTGEIAEVAVYSTNLNEAQRIILFNYFSAKYDVALTSNDNYDEDDNGNGDFDYEVAGIGQASDGSSHEDAQGKGILRINTPSGLGNSEFLIWGHDNGALNSFGETDLPTGIESRLAREWAFSETGEVGTVTLSFDLSDVAGSVTASDLRLLIDDDANGFSDESGGNVISGAVNTSGNIYEWTGVDIEDGDRITVGSVNFSNTPLPVELLSFYARLQGQEVLLTWQTASEINNDRFEVYRANNNGNWHKIGEVDGAGNSQSELHYQFTDTKAPIGEVYYRLRQVDFDGSSSYSHIETVRIAAAKPVQTLRLYPNPAREVLKVEHPEISGVQVYSIMGVDVTNQCTQRIITEGLLELNTVNLATGTYVLVAEGQSRLFQKD